ncbi:hypothetical protein SteCoe_18083 [Stentor coeruleus]|uniref:Uncharacterized protein n=1 Tax=Stentor coeruleus TaxID=5963 RepID=A0A1R2BXW3_9CILI|nr:hypothetical protein SteCoe_18083 [Stentor coeruleus]
MEYRNTIVFKDTEYLATVKAITETLTISLIDSKTQSVYTGTFTSSNIEELTSKTGNTKNFTVFCKLLVSSLQGKNPSLHLDFFSYQDLESIRKGSTFLGSSVRPSKKKYLIISYITEFEKVHYPLALLLQDNENDKSHEVSKEISYTKNQIDDFPREQTTKLKQENAFLNKKLSNFSDEFLAYKDKTDRKIEELTEIKHDLENEIQRMKEELDAIIIQLEDDAKKKAQTGNSNEIRYLKQNLAREKEENILLKAKLATCSKEIEVLRESDQGNKKMIEMLSRKMEEADEKSLDSPDSSESPQRSPFKFSDSESQGSKNCLNELGSNLTRVQYLLKKHKS